MLSSIRSYSPDFLYQNALASVGIQAFGEHVSRNPGDSTSKLTHLLTLTACSCLRWPCMLTPGRAEQGLKTPLEGWVDRPSLQGSPGPTVPAHFCCWLFNLKEACPMRKLLRDRGDGLPAASCTALGPEAHTGFLTPTQRHPVETFSSFPCFLFL